MHSVRAGAQPEQGPISEVEIRRRVNDALAVIGPLLLAASRAADSDNPVAARPLLNSAAAALLEAAR